MGQRLGQHFLVNKGKMREIIDALGLKSGDFVVEIGSGGGALTRELVARLQDCKIAGFVGIEKDEELVSCIKYLVSGIANFNVAHADALKLLPQIVAKYKLQDTNYKLVGNIPYYITGKLLRIIGELEHKPEVAVLTIQKEVAERVVAKPPKMNLLAACVQVWADAEIIGYIPRKDFKPSPEVDSAIVRLKVKSYKLKDSRALSYYALAKVLFKQPRKTILNNLITYNLQLITNNKQQNKEELVQKLQKLGIDPNGRPQDLGVEEIGEIAIKLTND